MASMNMNTNRNTNMSSNIRTSRALQKETRSSCFHILVTGQIEQATDFSQNIQNLYCRYVLSYGNDWSVIHGVTSAMTQLSYSKTNRIIWNFPIDLAFRSTNAFGWPRICVAVYGLDFFGRDVVRGYCSILIPTCAGRHELVVDMYRPISGSWCHEVMNWFKATLPEFYETAFTARNEGREVTRVECDGKINLCLNISTKDMEKFGFARTLASTDSKSN